MSSILAAEPLAKQLKQSPLTIGTHSGAFQCDEALGVWMLRQLPQYKDARVVRSRDPAVLEPCDIVIDVGGCYDPSLSRFDHHQRGFFETFDGSPGVAKDASQATGVYKTKLSATGLVYKHFGRDVIQSLSGEMSPSKLDAVYRRLYRDMIEGIDAIDNGIEAASDPLYREGTGLSTRVGRLNSKWNAPKQTSDQEDAAFETASAMCGREFSEQLGSLVDSWLPARDHVEKALLARSPSTVICFESGGMPWKEHLYELEREHGTGLVSFVLYKDGSGMWRVQAVTVEGTAFTNRVSLPASWGGLRDAELQKISKIPEACFCHAAGFIGGATTKCGALAMATEALHAAATAAARKEEEQDHHPR